MHEIPVTPDTQTRPEKSKSARLSLLVAAIATVLTPGAYLLGLSYYQGYLAAFGIGHEVFPISAPDVYVFSYQTVGYFLLMLGEGSAKSIERIFSPPVLLGVFVTIALLAAFFLLFFAR